MQFPWYLIAVSGLVFTLATPSSAQSNDAGRRALRPRWIPEKSFEFVLTPGDDPGRLVVKLADDAGAVVEAGLLLEPPPEARGGRDLTPLQRLLADLDFARVEPVFDVARAELDELRRAGEANLGEELADLSQFFFVELPPPDRLHRGTGADAAGVLARLLAMDVVENAYPAPVAVAPPGDYAPTTPFFEGSQGYLGAAPVGVDALWARTQTGGTGAGMRVADVEFSWNLRGLFGSVLGHEDLQRVGSQSPPPAVGNPSAWVDPFSDTNHGTAVAGVLAADRDAFGTTGIVPDAKLRVSAVQTTRGVNVAGAILRAGRALHPGDTLLIEVQTAGPNFAYPGACPGYPAGCPADVGFVPVEYNQAEFAAIRQVVALCVHVVEAAGNGYQDLDSSVPPYGHASYGARFDPARRYSGAIVIGAGTKTAPHLRMYFTNFGRRVDAYSWGHDVVTTGYGDLFDGNPLSPDPDQLFTQVAFAGTSSAASIVAGATAILGAAHKAAHGTSWDPFGMALCLRTSGTPTSLAFGDELIGRQPDLREQIGIARMGPHPALVLTDEAAGSYVLDDVATIGDVDQDGLPDHAIASSQAGGVGRVVVHSGRTGRVLATLQGAALDDRLGISVGAAGDVDGDSVPDLVVGAFRAPGGTDVGKVYVYSGATLGVIRTFTGGGAGDNLGYSVDGAGDVDGDGYADVVGGAFGANGGVGAAYVWSGRTGSLLHTFSGTQPIGHFGQAVAGAGDVDADGYADVIVGAPYTGGSGGAGGLQIGEVKVFSGRTGAQLRAWSGPNNFMAFGFAVDGAGDVDADGYDDLVVGAPYWDGAGSDSGQAYVFSGRTGSELWPGSRLGGTNANLGFSVAGAGDANGDGFAEVLAGAPLTGWGTFEGAAYLSDGRTGAVLRSYVGEKPGNKLGYAADTAGDVNGDAKDDVFLGSLWWDTGGAAAGRGYVFLTAKGCRLSGQRPR